MSAGVVVRAAATRDEAAWRSLWAQYVAFYESEVPPEVTDATWQRLLHERDGFIGRIAELNGAVIGFSVSIIHGGSWSLNPVCYLEDLFVSPEARRSGAGRALINDLVELAKVRGWAKLYWHTKASNDVARGLYDSFVKADEFVRYRLEVVQSMRN